MTQSAVRRIAAGTWRPPSEAAAPSFASDTVKLLAVRLTTMIVGMALLEGVALLGGVAYMLEAQPGALAVVAGALVLMAWFFPTDGRVRAWLAEREGELESLRQGRGL
jgi:hypothetical protein